MSGRSQRRPRRADRGLGFVPMLLVPALVLVGFAAYVLAGADTPPTVQSADAVSGAAPSVDPSRRERAGGTPEQPDADGSRRRDTADAQGPTGRSDRTDESSSVRRTPSPEPTTDTRQAGARKKRSNRQARSAQTRPRDASDEVLEQMIVLPLGGASPTDWCQARRDESRDVLEATPLVSRRGRTVDVAQTLEIYQLCFFGLDVGDEVAVEVVDPAGTRSLTRLTHSLDHGTFLRWVGLPTDPVGEYQATVHIGEEVVTHTWRLERRATPEFLVVNDRYFGGDGFYTGVFTRPATIAIALDGYAPATVVDLHLYEARHGRQVGRYRETLAIRTDAEGHAMYALEADAPSYAAGCYRMEERPAAVEFQQLEPYGRVFCVK